MADGVKLATGWLELVVSTPGAQKSITDAVAPAATKAGDAGGTSIGQALLSGMKKFAAPIAALAAGFGIKKIISDSNKAFMDLAGSTNALQRIAGGTKTEVSGLAGAMKLAGVNSDQVMGSLTIFSKNLGNAAGDADKASAMNAKLGTSFLDAAGQVKPMSDILPGLADKFQAMPDGAEKTALATQLFGRSGAQLLPFLNKGSAGIAELTTQAGKMGLVLDDVSGKIFSNAKVSTRNYQTAIQGLQVQLGQNLVPVLTAVQNIFRQAMIPILQSVTTVLMNHRGAFLAVAEGAQRFADAIGGRVTTGIAALGAAWSNFMAGFSGGGSGIFASLGAGVGQLVSQLSASFSGVWAAIAPAFQQLGPVFASLLPPLLQLWQSLSPTSVLFKALLPVLPQLATIIGQLAATVGGALGSALQTILPAIVQVATMLSGTLAKVLQALMPVITQLVSILAAKLASTLTALAPVVGQIAQVLGTVLGAILQALMPVISTLVPIISQLLTAFSPLVGILVPLIAAVLQLIAPLLQLIGPILIPLIQLVGALLTPILQLITPIVGLLVPAFQAIVSVLTTVIEWIVQAITWFVKLVTGNQQAGVQFQAVWSAVMGFFKGIGSYFAGIWNGLISGIGNFIGSVVGFFQSIPQKIMGVFAGAGKWLLDVGKNLIQGLLDGAGSLLKNIGNFFLSIVPGWILGPFKQALGINSPSRVFRQLGEYTMQGYVQGIDGSDSMVSRSLAAAVNIPSAMAGLSTTPTALAAAPAFPSQVTLVDRNGTLLGLMDVKIERSNQAIGTSISTGWNPLSFG
ncbi:phage tail protein [Leifsonia aquatica]|uniref:phage tail protein n=1 Tax=Leifsonia aquatica TaxID=144185 RepID=UPI00382272DB